MISCLTPANPVRRPAIALGKSGSGNRWSDFDQQGQVGQQPLAADLVEGNHRGIAEPAAAALVGPARIDKTIADHPLAPLKRWANQALNMVGAGRSEQQRFGPGVPPVSVNSQQERPNCLRPRGSAGFASHDAGNSARLQCRGEHPGLG